MNFRRVTTTETAHKLLDRVFHESLNNCTTERWNNNGKLKNNIIVYGRFRLEPSEIAESLIVSRDAAKKSVAELKKKRFVRRYSDGTYSFDAWATSTALDAAGLRHSANKLMRITIAKAQKNENR